MVGKKLVLGLCIRLLQLEYLEQGYAPSRGPWTRVSPSGPVAAAPQLAVRMAQIQGRLWYPAAILLSLCSTFLAFLKILAHQSPL